MRERRYPSQLRLTPPGGGSRCPYREGAHGPSAIKLTRYQREAIYQAVRTHLVGLSDVFTLLERQDDVPVAEKLAREFADDFRLLEDIGWHEDGSGSRSS